MAQDSSDAHLRVNPWLVAVAVMFGTFMEVLDTTVVNVSLPHIAGSMSATVEEATWVLSSYLVANAIVLPLTGWLANFFGRKRVLMLAVACFTITSLLCGLAPSLRLLVIFRILQGFSGGSLVPLSQAVLLETFPHEKRGKAMAFWGMGTIVAPILGPVLGGWITDSYTWRWVFYINIPVGIVSLFMIKQFIFDPPYIRRASSRVDYWGIGMLAVGIGALQMVLDKGQQEDWFASRWITAGVALSAILLVAFIAYELRIHAPVLDLRVFKNRTYGTGIMLTTMSTFGLYGSLITLPIFLQTLLGYPALQAGMATSPRGIGSFVAITVVGAMMIRFDARKLLVVGLVVVSANLFVLSGLSLDAGYWDIFWPQIIQGLGQPLIWVPLTTIAMSPIPPEAMGNATSIFNLTRNLGSSMGISTVTTLLARGQQRHLNLLVAHVTAYDPQVRLMTSGLRSGLMRSGSDFFTASRQSYAALFGILQRQAAMLTFIDIFRMLSAVFVLMIPLVLLLKRPVKPAESMPLE